MTMPAPTPAPSVTKTKSFAPRATPCQRSPSAAMLASLSTCTGTLKRACTRSRSGTFVQPGRFVAPITRPVVTSVMPGAPMPIAKSLRASRPDFLKSPSMPCQHLVDRGVARLRARPLLVARQHASLQVRQGEPHGPRPDVDAHETPVVGVELEQDRRPAATRRAHANLAKQSGFTDQLFDERRHGRRRQMRALGEVGARNRAQGGGWLRANAGD